MCVQSEMVLNGPEGGIAIHVDNKHGLATGNKLLTFEKSNNDGPAHLLLDCQIYIQKKRGATRWNIGNLAVPV